MHHRANHTSPSPAPVVLFGIDSNGKPKAARFGKDRAALAVKAASQLHLRVLSSEDPKIAVIAARLPVGRIHATGRTLVPFVRRDLYDKLIAAAPNGDAAQSAAPPASGTGGGSQAKPGAPFHLPRNWQHISVGDLVIAQETLEDGWYEAVVLDGDGEMLTVRWRDYPGEKPFVRNRHRLALLYPDSKPAANTAKSTKSPTTAKPSKPTDATTGLPKDWSDVKVGQLVLAQTEGPWAGWWEAMPVGQAGDAFTLRWRDYGNLPLVTRSRLDLALICPDAA